MGKSPVVVFAYNRRDKIEKCIRSLENNDQEQKVETDLFVFSDGPRSEKDEEPVAETRRFLEDYSQRSTFKSISLEMADRNRGLAVSVIEGVTKVINESGKAIVVEDDLVLSSDFLRFMNNALDFYSDNEEIGQVNGYTYPIKALSNYDKDVYFLRKGDCWGWGTWSDRWKNAEWYDVDFDEYRLDKRIRREFEKLECNWDSIMMNQYFGKNDSWAIRWVYYLYKNKRISVYPSRSRVNNVGFDGSGTHQNKNKFSFNLDENNGDAIMEREIRIDPEFEAQASIYPRAILPVYLADRCKLKIREIIAGLK